MSTGTSAWPRLVVGFVVVAAGFFCLNYTNGFGIDHHAEWAQSHGLPKPTYGIFLAGVVLMLLGGTLIGHALRARRS